MSIIDIRSSIGSSSGKRNEIELIVWKSLFNGDYVNYNDFTYAIDINDNDFNESDFRDITSQTFDNTFRIIINYNDNEIEFRPNPLNLETIIHLIETFAIDVNYINDLGNNCLMSACMFNVDFEVIEYLIEKSKVKIDINHTNNDGNTCLLLACQFNTNLKVIEYLINVHMRIIKTNTKNFINNMINNYGGTCLTVACWKNTNLKIIEYLINVCKMNINSVTDLGSTCLILACRGNTNLKVIRYLIEEHKLDINHKQNNGSDCLLSACYSNTKLKIIEYLIEKQNMDINQLNNDNETCLMLACTNNPNLKIIQYLIEKCKINIDRVNKYSNNCLMLACLGNTNLNIIKYLIEKCKMNINHTHNRNSTCLTLACTHNTNLKIIKYLIEEKKMDSKYVDNNDDSYFSLACWKNANLNVIKYLIEIQAYKMSINHTNNSNHDCLVMACMGNAKLEIIEFLVEKLKVDVNTIHKNGYTYLSFACFGNTNLNVFKYFIEKCKMDVNHVTNKGDTCLTIACHNNKNLKVIEYFIDTHGMNIKHINYNGYNCLTESTYNNNLRIIEYLLKKGDIDLVQNNLLRIEQYIKILEAIRHDYSMFNKILALRIDSFDKNKIKSVCKKYNPLIFDDINGLKLNLDNPYYFDFETFTSYVDKLVAPINKSLAHANLDFSIGSNFENDFDFENVKILFTHNNRKFYGDRKNVYESISILNELMDLCVEEEPDIVLSGNLPAYVINKYITSCYNGFFNLETIKEEDFMEFITFLDKYPTKHLSIDKLDGQIVKYLQKHNIKNACIDDNLVSICKRYKLKDLYLYFHNQKL